MKKSSDFFLCLYGYVIMLLLCRYIVLFTLVTKIINMRGFFLVGVILPLCHYVVSMNQALDDTLTKLIITASQNVYTTIEVKLILRFSILLENRQNLNITTQTSNGGTQF